MVILYMEMLMVRMIQPSQSPIKEFQKIIMTILIMIMMTTTTSIINKIMATMRTIPTKIMIMMSTNGKHFPSPKQQRPHPTLLFQQQLQQ